MAGLIRQVSPEFSLLPAPGEILREPMFALLLGAAPTYLALGDFREVFVLAIFASTSVLIAVVQDTRIERVLESLRDLTSPLTLFICLTLAFIAGLFVAALHQGLPEADAHSLAFTALVATNLGVVLVNRSRGVFLSAALAQPNPAVWWIVAATTALLTAVSLFAPARELFRFGPLHADDIAVVLGSVIAALKFTRTGGDQTLSVRGR